MKVNLDIDLRSQLGPVRDQGARATCLSHAVSASHEHVLASSARLSVEYLHYFAARGHPSKGSTIAEMRAVLEREGQPEERLCPDLTRDPPKSWMPAPGLPVFRRKSRVVPATVANAVEAIRATRIPILGIGLPHGFFRPKPPWIILPGNANVGLHAVVGVGLGSSDGESVILIRNSWGLRWGDGGHALLTSEFLRRHLVDVMLLAEDAAT